MIILEKGSLRHIQFLRPVNLITWMNQYPMHAQPDISCMSFIFVLFAKCDLNFLCNLMIISIFLLIFCAFSFSLDGVPMKRDIIGCHYVRKPFVFFIKDMIKVYKMLLIFFLLISVIVVIHVDAWWMFITVTL